MAKPNKVGQSGPKAAQSKADTSKPEARPSTREADTSRFKKPGKKALKSKTDVRHKSEGALKPPSTEDQNGVPKNYGKPLPVNSANPGGKSAPAASSGTSSGGADTSPADSSVSHGRRLTGMDVDGPATTPDPPASSPAATTPAAGSAAAGSAGAGTSTGNAPVEHPLPPGGHLAGKDMDHDPLGSEPPVSLSASTAPAGTGASTGSAPPIDFAALDGPNSGTGSRQIDPQVLNTVAGALEAAPHAVGAVPENELVAVAIGPDNNGNEVATFAAVDGARVTVTKNDDGTQSVAVFSGVDGATDSGGSGPGRGVGRDTGGAGESDSIAVVTEDGQLVVVKFDKDDGNPDSTSSVTVAEGAEVKSLLGNDGADSVVNNGTINYMYLSEGANKTVNNGVIGTIDRRALGDEKATIVNSGSIDLVNLSNARTAIINNEGAEIEEIFEGWPQVRSGSEAGADEAEIQITNRGDIGTVNLSEGNDAVNNDGHGHIGTVFMDGPNITVTNTATIDKVKLFAGRVNNEKRIDSIEYLGRHFGRAQINNGSDGEIDAITVQDPNAWRDYVFDEGVTIQNRGAVGSVSLGNSADMLFNSGKIGGKVDMGGGNDIVVLSSGNAASLETGTGADQVVVGPGAGVARADTGADQDFVFVKQGGKVDALETGTGPDTVRNEGLISHLGDAGGRDLYLGGPDARVASGAGGFEHRYAHEIKAGRLFLNGRHSNAAVEDILFATAKGGKLDVAFGIGGAVIHPFYDIAPNGRGIPQTFPEVVYRPNGKKRITITPQTPSGKTAVGQGAAPDTLHVSNEPELTPPEDYDPQMAVTSKTATGTYDGRTVSSADGYFTRNREIQGITVLASDTVPDVELRTTVYQLERLADRLPAEVRNRLTGLQVHLGGDYSEFYLPYLAGKAVDEYAEAFYNSANKIIALTSAEPFLHEFGHALQDLAGDYGVAQNKQTGEVVTLNDAIRLAFSTATKDESGWGTENWSTPEEEYWAQGHETGLGEKPAGRHPGFNPQSPAELEYADPELYAILQALYPGLL